MDILFQEIKSWFSLLPDFTISNAVEVLIIAFVLYEILLLIKNSHAISLIKGIAVIMCFTFIAAIARLDNILWILQNISTAAVIALVVIFQPELRKGLETLGKQKIVAKVINFEGKETDSMSELTCKEISKAVFEMAKVKTGALIVVEHTEDLKEYISTGIMINGIVSSALLINIFEKNTPLHDGAVIIRGNTVVSATCYLPLSENESISKDLGTRHRAAIGMSEATDSTIIVVSEETGQVSISCDGVLSRINSFEQLNTALMSLSTSLRNKEKLIQKQQKESRNSKKTSLRTVPPASASENSEEARDE